jgi:hypothetical protein
MMKKALCGEFMMRQLKLLVLLITPLQSVCNIGLTLCFIFYFTHYGRFYIYIGAHGIKHVNQHKHNGLLYSLS